MNYPPMNPLARNRKWLIHYDLMLDGVRDNDHEITVEAISIFLALGVAMSQIEEETPLDKRMHIDFWEVCELEE